MNICETCFNSNIYYLNNNKCIYRTIFGCDTYEKEIDGCKTCPLNYILNSSKTCEPEYCLELYPAYSHFP